MPDSRSLSTRDAAREGPGGLAILSGIDRWTWSELHAHTARARRSFLQSCGDGAHPRRQDIGAGLYLPEAPLAVVGHPRLSAVATILAAVEAGVPVALLHPRATERERGGEIERLKPRTVVDPEREAPGIAPADEEDAGPAPPASAVPHREAPLAVVSTSGSTGEPKWVVLSRRAFAAAAAASEANLGWRADDRWLLAMPLAHVGGLSILIRCWLARKTVVLHDAPRFDPEEVAGVIARQKVTLVSLVPTMLHRLLALSPSWQPPRRVRAILLGGAAASPALLAEARQRRWPVLTTYGLTEACSQVATQPYGSLSDKTAPGELGCGPPVANTEVRIDEGGQILVRGPQLMRGYLGQRPLAPGAWLATGDLGRLDREGNLHVEGRLGDRIVTGGENVDPLEVEHTLIEHPGIAAAAVVGLPHEEWGQMVAAAVVLDAEATDLPGDLGAHLGSRLASFKHPRRWAVVDALPVNASGKPDRRALERSLAALLES